MWIIKASSHWQRFYRGWQRYQAEISRLLKETAVQCAEGTENWNYLEYRLKHSSDRMFDCLLKNLAEERLQTKVKIYDKSKKTVNA